MAGMTRTPSGELPVALTRSAEHQRTLNSRVNMFWWYTVVSMWLLFGLFGFFNMVFGIFEVEERESATLVWVLHVLNVASVVSLCWLIAKFKPGFNTRVSRTVSIVTAVPPVALFIIGLVIDGSSYFSTHLYLLISVQVVRLPSPWRSRALGALFVVIAVLELPNQGAADGVFVLFQIFMSATVVASLWMWEMFLRNAEASTLAGQLAASEERLRIAADLHDVQGHNLQVIALEAELADRLIERDPIAAQRHIKNVRELVRGTQLEAKTLITGLREADVTNEQQNAAQVLTAAGISVRQLQQPPHLSEAARQLFTGVIREASTNILRHTRAEQVTFDWEDDDKSVTLSISNDGVSAPNQPTVEPSLGSGTGIRDLAARFKSAGGQLTHERKGETFTLTATLTSTGDEA